MSSPIGPADLTKYQSGLKFSDLHNWRHIPASAVVQPTAQMKAEMAASEAREKQQKIDFDAETKSNPDFYSPKTESNSMFLTNVATLPETELKSRIDYVTKLIKSGEAEKYSFQSGNGEQTTTSIHQYLYWLQQRFQTLSGDGTYSPEMFK
jgi:hypothetical protein